MTAVRVAEFIMILMFCLYNKRNECHPEVVKTVAYNSILSDCLIMGERGSVEAVKIN